MEKGTYNVTVSTIEVTKSKKGDRMIQVEFSSIADGSKLSSWFVTKFPLALESFDNFLGAINMKKHSSGILEKIEKSEFTKVRVGVEPKTRLEEVKGVEKPLGKLHGSKLSIVVEPTKDSDKFFTVVAYLPFTEDNSTPF